MAKLITIEILSDLQIDLASLLFDSDSVENGKSIFVSNDVELLLVNRTSQSAFAGIDPKEIIELTLSVTSNIVLGVIGNYVYDKINGRAESLWINSKKVKIDKETIVKELDESIKT